MPTVTALAGASLTFAIITDTTQNVVDALAALKVDKPIFEVISMCYDAQGDLSVLVQYST